MKKEIIEESIGDDDEIIHDEGTVLDPRAGRVDVVLPQIKFHPKGIIALLESYRFAEGSKTISRQAINVIIKE